MRFLVPFLGCVIAGAAAAVTPDWSVDVGDDFLDPNPRPVYMLGHTDRGHGLFLTAVGGSQTVAVLSLGTQDVARDQFGVSVFPPQFAAMALLATNATGALVRVSDDSSQNGLRRLDARGQLLWSRDHDADQARLLADGDALVLDGNVLARLSAKDGRVRWARNLLDLADGPPSGSYQLGDAVDGQIDITATYTGRPSAYALPPPRYSPLAIDTATGALRWVRQAPASDADTTRPMCAPRVWGEDRVDLRIEYDAVATTAVVERRRRVDGELLWSKRLATDATEINWCELAVSADQMYVSFSDGQAPGRLMALDTDGNLRWQQALISRWPIQMVAAADGDVILAEPDFDSAVAPQHVLSRWHAADGAHLWQFALPARLLDLGADGTGFTLAWVQDSAVSRQARYQRRSAADGSVLSEAHADVLGFTSAPIATVYANGRPCTASAAGAQPARVELACLDATTGVSIWTASLPLLDTGERVTALQLAALGPTRLLLRASTRLPITGGELPRDHLYAIDAASGAVDWHSIRVGFLGMLVGADADVYVSDIDCATPPSCSNAPYLLRKLAGTTGAELWTRPYGLAPLAAGAGVVVGWLQETARVGFQALDAATGVERWFFPVAATVPVEPAAMVTTSGALIIKHEPSAGIHRDVEVRRLDPGNGSEVYSLTPSLAAVRTELGLLHESLTGDLLVTAAQSSGAWLLRARTSDGVPVWQSYPPALPEESRWVRFAGARPAGDWAYQIRRRGQWLERRALSRLDPQTGTLSGEHLYATAVPPFGGSFGAVALMENFPDGGTLAIDRNDSVHGLTRTRLQRWPAPGDAQGDIRIQISTPEPGTGMTPFTEMRLLISNDSPNAVAGLRVRANSEFSTLWFHVRGCEPQSSCLHPVAGSDELAFSMPAQSAATVTFDVIDPGFRPQAIWGEDSARFWVDTPFGFGDLDLGNNVVIVPVRLGGMADGFEGDSKGIER